MFELKITTELNEVVTYFGDAETVSETVREWLLTSDETPIYGLEITPKD
jgi:hypothetical protein